MAKLRVDKIASVGVSTETTGSVFFDGTDDFMGLDGSDDFAFGTGGFTIEFWVYFSNGSFSSDSVDPNLIDFRPASTNGLYPSIQYDTSANDLLYYVDAAGRISGGQLSDETWYHIAVARDGTSTKMFVNGSQVGSTYSDSNDYLVGTNRPVIGCQGHTTTNNDRRLDGYISNLRICKGHAVYTENFTPPTRELEVHPETVFLGLYDGENIFADKSGRHTIAAYGDRLSSPTPTATDSPIGITTNYPPVTRNVDPTAGPTFQGGAGYTSQNWLTLPKGTTTERFVEVANNAVSASSARGIFQGGAGSPTNVNTIEYVTIGSLGDGTDFGDMTIARQYRTSVSSSTRGVTAGGDPTTDVIDYITISTLGNAQDFGNLFTGRYGTGGCSSSIRGVWAGGFPGFLNTMDYVTIASTGDAKDFGDLTTGRGYLTGCGSPSRGLFAGGLTPTKVNTIDFITIASMGNAFDFGDLTSTRAALAGCSNSIRGVFAGGNTPTMVNTIDFVSIQTTGNAVDFGDQSVTRENMAACSSSTRGVWGGGNDPSNTKRNTIDYVELATLGDAIDIGDLTPSRKGVAGCSNGHGGLG